MSRSHSLLILVLIAVVVLVAGCGGGGSSSSSISTSTESGDSTEASGSTFEDSGSAEHEGETIKGLYIEKADAICQAFKDENEDEENEFQEVGESEDVETPAQEVKLSKLLADLISKSEQEGEQISALNPPSEDQDIVDKWISDGEEANVLLTEANGALEAGELSRFADLLKEGATLSQKGHAVAQGYGFEVCGAEEE